MEIKFYVNPDFVRGTVSNGKIMFKVENLGYFGTFVNGQNGNIEKQAYEYNGFRWNNISGNAHSKIYCTFSELKSMWNSLTPAQQEKVSIATTKAIESFRYFVKKYNNQIATYPNPRNIVNEINDYVWYFTKFVNALRNNQNPDIDPKYESGLIANNSNTAEVKANTEVKLETKTRKSIAMFKLLNASNFSNLFENNIYPIVKSKDGYYTIKDNNGNEYTVRASRGKEIKVYTDCPA